KNCYNYENFDEVRDNPDIDAIYVITPNALHYEHVIRAAKAGKHVICEKPMAINAKEGEDMVRKCKEANVKLLVGSRMQSSARKKEMRQMMKNRELGILHFIQGEC